MHSIHLSTMFYDPSFTGWPVYYFHLGHARGAAGSSLATGYTKSECLLRAIYLCSA